MHDIQRVCRGDPSAIQMWYYDFGQSEALRLAYPTKKLQTMCSMYAFRKTKYCDKYKYKYRYTFYSLTLKSRPSWVPFGPRQGP